MNTRMNWLSAALLAVALYVVPAQAQQCVPGSTVEGVAITAMNAAVDSLDVTLDATANAIANPVLGNVQSASNYSLQSTSMAAQSILATLPLLGTTLGGNLTTINNLLVSANNDIFGILANFFGIPVSAIPAGLRTTITQAIQAIPPVCAIP